MAEFDLTMKIVDHLDLHLIIPLLEFFSGSLIITNILDVFTSHLIYYQNILELISNIYNDIPQNNSCPMYNEQDVLKEKLRVLNQSKMMDFVCEVYQEIYPTRPIPDEMVQRRKTIVRDLTELQAKIDPIYKILNADAIKILMDQAKDGKLLMELLEERHNFKMEYVDTMYQFAKIQFDTGDYSNSAIYLNFCRVLISPTHKHAMDVLWGLLASNILIQNFDAALEDVNRLKEVIESKTTIPPLELLEQRTWLIHWSLFVFFNHNKGLDCIVEMFIHNPSYLNTIQTVCPHIIRYIATAIISNKKKRSSFKELVQIVQHEIISYRDPIVEFIECLYVHYDFTAARYKLEECKSVLQNDFFIVGCVDDFINNGRMLIFETFIRIHQCISIDMVAEKLSMTVKEAEFWIVDLIRQSSLLAKLDSKQGHVVMGLKTKSPYQQVIDKTSDLCTRSGVLSMKVENLLMKNMLNFNIQN